MVETEITLPDVAQEAREKHQTFSEATVREKLHQIQTEIDELMKRRGQFFGIESGSNSEILAKLDARIRALEEEKTDLEADIKYQGRFPRISLETLKLRDKEGFPRFVLFGLDNAEAEISATGVFRPESMPKELTSCYSDVMKKLSEKEHRIKNKRLWWVFGVSMTVLSGAVIALAAVYSWWILFGLIASSIASVCITDSSDNSIYFNLTAQYQGLIPDYVRQKIHEAKKQFSQIYILADCPWKLNRVLIPRPRLGCPLVLGCSEHSTLFLIADYQTSQAEDYLKSEYTESGSQIASDLPEIS